MDNNEIITVNAEETGKGRRYMVLHVDNQTYLIDRARQVAPLRVTNEHTAHDTGLHEYRGRPVTNDNGLQRYLESAIDVFKTDQQPI